MIEEHWTILEKEPISYSLAMGVDYLESLGCLHCSLKGSSKVLGYIGEGIPPYLPWWLRIMEIYCGDCVTSTGKQCCSI